ncbi:MAG: DsbA family protein [Roseiarcus sp.]|jgi:protein-disulfide isomerase
MNRRRLLRAAALLAVSASPLAFGGSPSLAAAGNIDIEAILNDPETPVAGNPEGDVTIVAFMDYNCPFCKKSSPDLERLVQTDGKLRLVYKDWPILTEASVYGARQALAAKYQGRYHDVHVALMGIHGQKITEEHMLAAIKAAGVDMTKLADDLNAHDADITALLKRNVDEADSLGLQGTPVFLIGPYKVAKALDYDEFKEVVANFRERVGK